MKHHAIRVLVLCAIVAGMARQEPTRVSAGPTQAVQLTNYAATLLAQQNGSGAAGAVAIVKGATAITVAVTVAGLTPMSAYRARIQSGGSCNGNGTVVDQLSTLQADPMGDAMAFTNIHSGSVSAAGYYLTVLSTAAKPMSVACGNLKTPDLTVPLTAVGGSKVKAVALLNLHAPVNGASTQLGTQVLVYAGGLQPKTPQANHIHAGLCGMPSPVRYPLITLVPDAQGRAVAGTGITDLVPTTGLSIHIHDDTFKVIACGNISP
jgi:hypothetical protein